MKLHVGGCMKDTIRSCLHRRQSSRRRELNLGIGISVPTFLMDWEIQVPCDAGLQFDRER